MKLKIPKNPGLLPLLEDPNDYQYGAIFGSGKDIPRKFRRTLPAGINIPYQAQVPACVNCTYTFINQYKSRINDNNDVNLSWRKLHAETGPYNQGRDLRTVAKYLQGNGQPEDKYLVDDAMLPETEFMKATLSIEGIANALKRKIGNYTFITPWDLNEVCFAVTKEPTVLTLGGANVDWSKSHNQVIKQTTQPVWYHAICGWDYDLDENWIGIYNWWLDGYRRVSLDYPLTGALSFEDLPDGEITNMLRAVQVAGKVDIYIQVGNKKHLIPDSDTQRYYIGVLGILNPSVDTVTQEVMDSYEEGEMLPSVKLMRAIEPIARDIFLKNSN